MKTIAVDGPDDSFENGLIQSLCYLYAETLKKGFGGVADIMEPMLAKCIEVIRARGGTMPAEGEDSVKLFLMLRKFRCLNSGDKQAFLRLIETFEEGGGAIAAE